VDLDSLEQRAVGRDGNTVAVGRQHRHGAVLGHANGEPVGEVRLDVDRMDHGRVGHDALEGRLVEVERRHPLRRDGELGTQARGVRRGGESRDLHALDADERRVAEPQHVAGCERDRERDEDRQAAPPVAPQRRGDARKQADGRGQRPRGDR
jgi:hypothetical protein